jgi:hypothetical protein
MKRLVLFAVILLLVPTAFSQEIYLSGRITGFDINNTGIDRPVDIIKMQGYILLDKSDLVIQTKRKGKVWIQHFKVDSIGGFDSENDNLSYGVWAKDSQKKPTHFRIKSFDDYTWLIEYNANNTKWTYTGPGLKKWLIDNE